jgi:hypothetical protein
MRVVIIQPHFLPFVGYFDLMRRADIFVYYDTVQFRARSWHCRTYIREQGQAAWLTAPVSRLGGSRRMLLEMYLDDKEPWRAKVARRLKACYPASRDSVVLTQIVSLVRSGPSELADWNIAANAVLAHALDIRTPTLRASMLGRTSGEKQQRLLHICGQLGATTYVCGPGSRCYVREADFESRGISVEWVDYGYRNTLPLHDGRTVFPSVLDSILTAGVEAARAEVFGLECRV